MNKNINVPIINSEGIFEFLPPFDKIELNKKQYKVMGIRNIKTMNEEDEAPYENIYQANGISLKEFLKDMEDEIPIIVLSYNEEDLLYIPANRIKTVPTQFGYKYTGRMISFKLGPIYDEIDLSNLYTNIEEYIKDALNVDITIVETPYTETLLISKEEHNERMRNLSSKGNVYKSFKTLYTEASRRNAKLIEKLKILENTIARMLTEKENIKATETVNEN